KSIEQYNGEWTEFISMALFVYQTMQHHTTRYEPFFLVYGRDAMLLVKTVVVTFPAKLTTKAETQDYLF
ncbi:19737_t:CDS:1, partial [Dentiscutata erythropus]